MAKGPLGCVVMVAFFFVKSIDNGASVPLPGDMTHMSDDYHWEDTTTMAPTTTTMPPMPEWHNEGGSSSAAASAASSGQGSSAAAAASSTGSGSASAAAAATSSNKMKGGKPMPKGKKSQMPSKVAMDPKADMMNQKRKK